MAAFYMRRTSAGYLAPDDDRAMKILLKVPIGSMVRVEFPELTKRRTNSQNALYWKWLTEAVKAVSDHTGNDIDDLHEFFKHKFLSPRIIEVRGETVRQYTTTKLTTQEMADYTNRIYAWVAAELGISLPLPEEMGRAA